MGYPTHVEWTDATLNTVGGCSIESAGCTNCYAQRLAGTRLHLHPLYRGTTTQTKIGPVFNGFLTTSEESADVWQWPCKWRGSKTPRMGAGMPSLIFVADMSDLFHPDRPIAVIDRVVASIIYSRHIGQFLTKRPHVMAKYFLDLRNSARWLLFDHPVFGKPNFAPDAEWSSVFNRVWLGSSVENQGLADVRRESMEVMSGLGGVYTFVSYEPALGPVNWAGWEFIDQIIAGGESGDGRRDSNPSWFRKTRDWCAENDVAFFQKQMTAIPPDLLIRQFPKVRPLLSPPIGTGLAKTPNLFDQ